MAGHDDPGFLHLNRGGGWPGFAWYGLELGPDGALRLESLPRLLDPLPEGLDDCVDPGPAGVAVSADGTVFWSDADRGLIHRIPACRGAASMPVEEPVADEARGRPVALWVHEARKALLVADARRHRIHRYALDDLQWLGSWGDPGSADGQFDRPVALAGDATGHIYVADAGNGRVQKLDRHGAALPGFAANLSASAPGLTAPVALSLAASHDGLWILGAGGDLVLSDFEGQAVKTLSPGLARPSAVLDTGAGLFLGDNRERRVIRFTADGARVGEAHGYPGPVAGMARTARGFLVAPGCSRAPLAFDPAGAHVTQALLWSEALADGADLRAWQRLQPVGENLAHDAVHVQWFVATGEQLSDAPPDPAPPVTGFDPAWRALAPDAPDVWIGEEARYLWLGARIEGDGLTSPALVNLRLERDRAGYARHLPAIYQTRAEDPESLVRFLGLFESFFEDQEQAIDALSALFVPESVPAVSLPWLAGWLGLDLDEAWPESRKREAIAAGWDRHRWRGTARGLRAALRLYASVDALVEEPLMQAAWWALAPEGSDPDSAVAGASVLGFSTQLAGREPAGAVLGSSAVLDQSDLTAGDDYGAPLFEPLSHRFSIRIYERQLSDPEDVEHIRRVVEREKPAHTAYDICVIRPALRLGYQARLGVDAVVGGGERRPTLLGVTGQEGFVLSGPARGRLGVNSRVGQSTRLDAGVVESSNLCQTTPVSHHPGTTSPGSNP